MIGLRTRTTSGARRSQLPSRATFAVRGGATGPFEARTAAVSRIEDSVEEPVVATVKLLVSEVVTNCVEHGGATEADRIDLELTLRAERLRLEVSTGGPEFDHDPGLPAELEARGRGLFLVDAMASDWGIRCEGGRAAVWFEVELTA